MEHNGNGHNGHSNGTPAKQREVRLTEQEYSFFQAKKRRSLLFLYSYLRHFSWRHPNKPWPSQAEMAKETGINVLTIRGQLRRLVTEGAIKRIAGSGRLPTRYVLTLQIITVISSRPSKVDQADRANLIRQTDQIRSPLIDRLTNVLDQTTTIQDLDDHVSPAEAINVVVSPSEEDPTTQRLRALGVPWSDRKIAKWLQFPDVDRERGLMILKDYNNPEDPGAILWSATAERWQPNHQKEMQEARASSDARAQREQDERDAIARCFGYRLGMAEDQILEALRQDLPELDRPLQERLSELKQLRFYYAGMADQATKRDEALRRGLQAAEQLEAFGRIKEQLATPPPGGVAREVCLAAKGVSHE